MVSSVDQGRWPVKAYGFLDKLMNLMGEKHQLVG